MRVFLPQMLLGLVMLFAACTSPDAGLLALAVGLVGGMNVGDSIEIDTNTPRST